MSQEIKTVPVGSLQIDCSAMASFLQDLAPGELRGKQVTQPGYADVVTEIVSNQAQWGSQAGVMDDDIRALQLADERIALIDAHLPAVDKLRELLVETRAVLDDERQRRAFEIAALVDARSKARRSPELLAVYQKTRAYRSSLGLKAARTRRRNAAALQASQPPADEPANRATTPETLAGKLPL